jgi:hypothetical protein
MRRKDYRTAFAFAFDFDVILKRTDQVRSTEGYPAAHFDAGVCRYTRN